MENLPFFSYFWPLKKLFLFFFPSNKEAEKNKKDFLVSRPLRGGKEGLGAATKQKELLFSKENFSKSFENGENSNIDQP